MPTLKELRAVKDVRYVLISYDRTTMMRECTYTSDIITITEQMLRRQDLGHLLIERGTLTVSQECLDDVDEILALLETTSMYGGF